MTPTPDRPALILAGGTLPLPDLWPQLLQGDPLVIAADGGLAHARVLGVNPQLLVGDLDSVEAADLRRHESVPVESHPTDKDQLDLELALAAAWARGATSVKVAGGLGDRLDQTLAALLIAGRAAQKGHRVALYGGRNEAQPVTAGTTLTTELAAGTNLSLLALGEGCCVSVTGVAFPLTQAELPWGSGLGVSNRALGGAVHLTVHSGTAALLLEHAGPGPRHAIWGDQAERIGAAIGAADPDLRQMIERFVYDEVFARPGLELATRELISVALLTSLGASRELTTHLRGALRTGATERQLRETILHSAVFAGVPRALAAMRELEKFLNR